MYKEIHTFHDKNLTKLANKIEDRDLIRKNYMNKLREDIKKLEKALQSWSLPVDAILNIPNNESMAIVWSVSLQRLCLKIGNDKIKPLIEMPFQIREKIYKKGLLSIFLEKGLDNIILKTEDDDGCVECGETVNAEDGEEMCSSCLAGNSESIY